MADGDLHIPGHAQKHPESKRDMQACEGHPLLLELVSMIEDVLLAHSIPVFLIIFVICDAFCLIQVLFRPGCYGFHHDSRL